MSETRVCAAYLVPPFADRAFDGHALSCRLSLRPWSAHEYEVDRADAERHPARDEAPEDALRAAVDAEAGRGEDGRAQEHLCVQRPLSRC